MRVSQRLGTMVESETVRLADLADTLKRQGHTILDFSAGRASDPTPRYICRAAENAMESGDTHQTPARGKLAYLNACAVKLKRENGIEADPGTEIIATMGNKQGLVCSLLAGIDPGDEVIVEDPGFVSYLPAIQLAGGIPVPVPLRPENNYFWDPAELEKAVSNQTRALIFCSPHNPCGRVHTEAELEILESLAEKHNLTVITDEIYERLTWDGRVHRSLAARPKAREHTITLMGTTKAYAMGGWRIGFASGPAPLIEAMTKVQQHMITSANSICQSAAAHIFASPVSPELSALWNSWETCCHQATVRLDAIPGIRCPMPEGGFYAWIDISKLPGNSLSWAHHILETSGVVLVPGAAFGPQGDQFLRMTCVKEDTVLEAGLELLESVFQTAPAPL